MKVKGTLRQADSRDGYPQNAYTLVLSFMSFSPAQDFFALAFVLFTFPRSFPVTKSIPQAQSRHRHSPATGKHTLPKEDAMATIPNSNKYKRPTGSGSRQSSSPFSARTSSHGSDKESGTRPYAGNRNPDTSGNQCSEGSGDWIFIVLLLVGIALVIKHPFLALSIIALWVFWKCK